MKFSVLLFALCSLGVAFAEEEPVSTNAVPAVKSGRAKITSDSTFYDRNEGIVVFTGKVCVTNEDYCLHSNRAFVFLEGTNELKRIVATGAVALTNGTRRAYGEKVTYRRDSGLVILYGGEKTPAIVRDELKGGPQEVKGRKIRFWIDREQVEVEGADISASTGGKGGLDRDGLKDILKH